VKPVFEKTPHREWESFHCELIRGSSYHAAWHFHPELQLTLVLRSRGYRVVGDKITALRPGDLVLVGANLPHVWHQEPPGAGVEAAVHAIVVRFRETFAGRDLLELAEVAEVCQLFRRAGRGLEITGRTRQEAARRLEQLPRLTGLARLNELLAILGLLAQSRELKSIASTGYVPNLSTDDQERMERITSHIHAHLDEPIGRAQVARTAHLSPGAFSRFFKLRTGKSLPEYVNELRVGHACRLLANERSKIIDIALESGFSNLANFNRRFRQITKVSPRDYRRFLRQNAAPVQALAD
jgi:AraC-like DNA-binding protein